MKRVESMTDEQLAAELAALDRRFRRELRSDPDFEGHGGSPGEWMVERMMEVNHEQRLRAIKAICDGAEAYANASGCTVTIRVRPTKGLDCDGPRRDIVLEPGDRTKAERRRRKI